MSLQDRYVTQMLGVGFAGLEPPDYILQWLREGRIGAIVLFARNVASPQQLADLTHALHQAAKYPLLIAIDQEGGMVARLRRGFTESPGAMALGAADDEALAEEVAAMMAAELRALGINWVLAPVLDLAQRPENPVIGTRTLGRDPQRVAALAAAQIRGFQISGVMATAKHFPGHGNTAVDSHVALPTVQSTLDDLKREDLVPFRVAFDAGVGSVMPGHLMNPALDPDYPASISQKITTGLLRNELGFAGLAATDCMEMGAIVNQYGSGESAVLAALAGQDIIFFSHSYKPDHALYEDVTTALENAVQSGRLPLSRVEAALARIDQAGNQYAITQEPDPSSIRQAAHLEIARKAARSAVTVIHDQGDLLPLRPDPAQKIALVEFAQFIESEAMDQTVEGGLSELLAKKLPQIEMLGLSQSGPNDAIAQKALALAGASDLLVLATRSAHLNPQQMQLAEKLVTAAQHCIVICLRNPYDAGALLEAATVICTCGDATPSLEAAADGLMGEFELTGRLPVKIGD